MKANTRENLLNTNVPQTEHAINAPKLTFLLIIIIETQNTATKIANRMNSNTMYGNKNHFFN